MNMTDKTGKNRTDKNKINNILDNNNSPEIKYVFSKCELENVIQLAGREGVEAYLSEQKKHNDNADKNKIKRTKQLMASYRRLKEILGDVTEFTEDEKMEFRWKFMEDLMGNARDFDIKLDLKVQQIELVRKENAFCVSQIEKALKYYRDEAERSENEEFKRQYRVFEEYYISDNCKSVDDIAEDEIINKRTVYRDIDRACQIMATYMLGV